MLSKNALESLDVRSLPAKARRNVGGQAAVGSRRGEPRSPA
jgi:hypothetical protein